MESEHTNMQQIIQKTKMGQPLTADEISRFVQDFTDGKIPDSQMSAWAMAVCLKGLSRTETAQLTLAMARSGYQLNLDDIEGIKVDKHSTGGVGDKTTLVLIPLVAAAGVPIAKMSGRGLGFGGGTIDKLEAIPGFQVERTEEQFKQQLRELNVAIMSQSKDMAPADKKLYSLRDFTSTVESVPLIASSVMSKKIAAGANAILLDVKAGDGAFMKSLDDAIELAKTMVSIGEELDRKMIAVVSDMNQPLGSAIGNGLEVKEAIDTLKGEGPADLEQLCLIMASYLLVMGGKATSLEDAKQTLTELLQSGAAVEKLKAMVAAQGGDTIVVDEPQRLVIAPHQVEVRAPQAGFVTSIHTEQLGYLIQGLGAGRKNMDDALDYGVGAELLKKVGDEVQAGDVIAILHLNEAQVNSTPSVSEQFLATYEFGVLAPEKEPLIRSIVDKNGVHEFKLF